MFIKKFKMFISIKKEEEFLNSMAKNGLVFIKRTYFLKRYCFEKRKNTNVYFEIDCRVFKNKEAYQNYIIFIEDFGWKHVHGKFNSGFQYFSTLSKSEKSILFSDFDSTASKYMRFFKISIFYFILFLSYIVSIEISMEFNFNNLSFLTPNISHLEGWDLFKKIIFEIPFVFMRFVPVCMILYCVLLNGLRTIKAISIYYKYKSRRLMN